MQLRVLLPILLASMLMAQPIAVGLRAGVPVTSSLHAGGSVTQSAGHYVVGPAFEVRLSHRASIGADFLFRSAGLALSASRATVREWEMPASFSWTLRDSAAHPFVRAGASLVHVFDIDGAAECARGPFGERFYCIGGSPVAELRHRTARGPLAGGGLQFRLGRFRIVPEVRLTRPIDRNFGVRDSAVRSNLTRIEILAGIRF